MASRRDAPRPRTASTSESTPTLYPPESGAQGRATPERRAPTEKNKESRGTVQTEAVRSPRAEVSLEERYRMIQEAAYLRAERRGFEPGQEVEDWLAAESEVDRLLSGPEPARPQ